MESRNCSICKSSRARDSFNPVRTTLADYQKVKFLEGEEMYQLRGKPDAMAGKLSAIEEAGGAEIVPLFFMSAQSGGTADHKVVDFFLCKILPGL